MSSFRSFPIIPASSHDQGTNQNPCPPHCPLLPRRTVQAASQVAMHQLPSDWWVADSSEHEGAQSTNCAARVSFTSNSQHAFPTQTSAERFEMEYNIYIYTVYIYNIYIYILWLLSAGNQSRKTHRHFKQVWMWFENPKVTWSCNDLLVMKCLYWDECTMPTESHGPPRLVCPPHQGKTGELLMVKMFKTMRKIVKQNLRRTKMGKNNKLLLGNATNG